MSAQNTIISFLFRFVARWSYHCIIILVLHIQYIHFQFRLCRSKCSFIVCILHYAAIVLYLTGNILRTNGFMFCSVSTMFRLSYKIPFFPQNFNRFLYQNTENLKCRRKKQYNKRRREDQTQCGGGGGR